VRNIADNYGIEDIDAEITAINTEQEEFNEQNAVQIKETLSS
jgi:hypothetical protein